MIALFDQAPDKYQPAGFAQDFGNPVKRFFNLAGGKKLVMHVQRNGTVSISTGQQVEGSEQDNIGETHDEATVNSVQHIGMPRFWHHAHTRNRSAGRTFLAANNKVADNLIVKPAFVRQTPSIPSGIGGVGYTDEGGRWRIQ